MSMYELDTRQCEKIIEQVMRFADRKVAEGIINNYLSGDGGDILKTGIHDILPVSGRHFKGKAAAAKSSDPFNKVKMNLGVKIKSKTKYNYLYFPDDGSNTIHHVGNQQFMFLGADAKAQEVADNIVKKMIKELEG